MSSPRCSRQKPDPKELLQHLDEIGLGLKFVVAAESPSRMHDGGAGVGTRATGMRGENGETSMPLSGGALRDIGSPNIVLSVKGMMCQKSCGSTVKKALCAVTGVIKAEVSFAEKRARVWTNSRRPTDDALIAAVEGVGFEAATVVKALSDVELDVEGMMCQKNCGSTVKAALEAVVGVERAEVSFAERRARVWGAKASPQALVDAVEVIGFGAALKLTTVVLDVEGMMCQKNCGSTIQKALEAVPEVSRAEVSFAEKRAKVWGGPRLTAGKLVKTVEAIGFEAAEAPVVVLEVEGMMCQKNCGTTVQNALEAVPGVTRAEVSFARKRARVWGSEAEVSSGTLVDAIIAIGFDARQVSSSPSPVGSSSAVVKPVAANVGGTTTGADLPVQGLRARASKASMNPRIVSTARGSGGEKGADKPLPVGGGRSHHRQANGAGNRAVAGKRLSTGTFGVEGMSCAACVGKVERTVSALRGVSEVRVALLAGQVRCWYLSSL